MIKPASSTRVPLVSVEHSLNGAQFLNTNCVASASGCFLLGLPREAAAAIALVTVIFRVTEIYASEQPQSLNSNELVQNFIG